MHTNIAAADSGYALTPAGLGYCARHGREAIERRIERHLALVSALIGVLDLADGDENLEPSISDIGYPTTDDREHDCCDDGELDRADDEPSLGAPEIPATSLVPGGWGGWHREDGNQERWANGHGDDEELVNEDGGDVQDEPHDPDTDLEHSLGWGFAGMHQGQGCYLSHGQGDDDREGDLDTLEGDSGEDLEEGDGV
jgi:hypothetical protein